jgi:hypothetical protein
MCWPTFLSGVAVALGLACAGKGARQPTSTPEYRDPQFEAQVAMFRAEVAALEPCRAGTVALSVEDVLAKTWANHDLVVVRGRVSFRSDDRTCTLMECEGKRCCNGCSEPTEETWTLTGAGGAIAVALVGWRFAHSNLDCGPAALDLAFRDQDVVLTVQITEAGRLRNEWRTQPQNQPPAIKSICRPS